MFICSDIDADVAQAPVQLSFVCTSRVILFHPVQADDFKSGLILGRSRGSRAHQYLLDVIDGQGEQVG